MLALLRCLSIPGQRIDAVLRTGFRGLQLWKEEAGTSLLQSWREEHSIQMGVACPYPGGSMKGAS